MMHIQPLFFLIQWNYSQIRITMTGTLILNNSPLLIPVFGEDKKAVIEHLADRFSPSNDTPAAYILSHAVDATVYTTE